MSELTRPLPGGRGCGERKRDSLYLCCGIGGGGLTVEDLVIDPVRLWPFGWQRGFTLLEDNRGINHVLVFVGKGFYPAPWDFIEEARRFGVSRSVHKGFPIEKLTPKVSMMYFAHARAWPLFEFNVLQKYHERGGANGYHVPPWKPEQLKKIENAKEPCTFASKSLSALIHTKDVNIKGQVTIQRPSFSYTVYSPEVQQDQKLEWRLGIFWSSPISHIEARDYLNPGLEEKVNSVGYETYILPY